MHHVRARRNEQRRASGAVKEVEPTDVGQDIFRYIQFLTVIRPIALSVTLLCLENIDKRHGTPSGCLSPLHQHCFLLDITEEVERPRSHWIASNMQHWIMQGVSLRRCDAWTIFSRIVMTDAILRFGETFGKEVRGFVSGALEAWPNVQHTDVGGKSLDAVRF